MPGPTILLSILDLGLGLGLGMGMLAEASEIYHHLPLPLPPSAASRTRRQVTTATCDQTYGNGSIPCGGSDSTWCYNPSLGQTCCELDGGFCASGSYCAPTAGYCCLESEDLETCARNAGFDLPGSTTARTDQITSSIPTMTISISASRTLTVTPFLVEGAAPTQVVTTDPAAGAGADPFAQFLTETSLRPLTASCGERPGFTALAIPISNDTSVSPLVQVAAAAKSRRLLGSVALIAMTGILTLCR